MSRKNSKLGTSDQLPGSVAFDRLLSAIEDGELLSGMRLREVELAAQFNLSRTPIREALKRLESQGLVSHVPYRGTSVTAYDYSEIAELFTVREALEGAAAALAARNATPVEIEQLEEMVAHDRAIVASVREGTDEMPLDLLTTNKDFHRQIHFAARNRFLNAMIEGLWSSMALIQNRRLSQPRGTPSIDDHEEIVKCIAARDEAGAEAAARKHVRGVYKARIKRLRITPSS